MNIQKEECMSYQIAIDGPSGAGKSTVAKALAAKRGIIYVDTGALYRAVGLAVRNAGIDPADEEAVTALLPGITLDIRFEDGVQHILLCGEDVGDRIRTPEISMAASRVSAIGAVRAFLLDTQRNLGNAHSVVMDGRDIGTVIFPKAAVKVFLTATPEARAQRRYEELRQKGMDVRYEDILRDMQQRDENDRSRTIAPAVAAPDAVELDSSGLTVEEVVARIDALCAEKLGQQSPAVPARTAKGGRFYLGVRAVLGWLLRILFRLKIHGRENIPQEGGWVVICNHIAVKDITLLGIAFPRQIRFLAKAELFRIPLLRHLFRAMGAVPVDRGGSDVQSLKTMVGLSQDGYLVGVFPQGHRRPGVNPADTPVKSGAALIACRAGVGMIPVCIRTKGVRYRFLRRKDLYIGKPVSYGELFTDGGRAEYAAATERMFGDVCRLGGYDKSPSPTLPGGTEET